MTRDTLFVTTVRRRRAAVAKKWPKNYTSLKLLWAPAHRTDARRRTRSAQVHVTASQSPLPRDVFKLVISFWAPSPGRSVGGA